MNGSLNLGKKSPQSSAGYSRPDVYMASINDLRRKLMITRAGQAQLLAQRREGECPCCRGKKKQGDCFCIDCYFALPAQLRTMLYTDPLDSGEWFENYVIAKIWLRQHGVDRRRQA